MGRIFGWVASSLGWPARMGNTLCNYMSSVIVCTAREYINMLSYICIVKYTLTALMLRKISYILPRYHLYSIYNL